MEFHAASLIAVPHAGPVDHADLVALLAVVLVHHVVLAVHLDPAVLVAPVDLAVLAVHVDPVALVVPVRVVPADLVAHFPVILADHAVRAVRAAIPAPHVIRV